MKVSFFNVNSTENYTIINKKEAKSENNETEL